MTYEFTNNWFRNPGTMEVWSKLLRQWKPEKILEVGCYEGSCTTFLIDNNYYSKNMKIWAVDTWEGSMEHDGIQMNDVEARFDRNVALAKSPEGFHAEVIKMKGYSHRVLSSMIEKYENHMDLIYIDGSHMAADVLMDAVLAFKLTRPGGLIAFDDWHWKPDEPQFKNPTFTPKMAIDSFVSIYWDKISPQGFIGNSGVEQMFIKKNIEE